MFTGVVLFILIVVAAMAHACFISTGGGQLAGRLLFIPVACLIGALMGAAGTLIAFGILMLYILFSVLKAAASSKGGVFDSSSNDSNPHEIQISVPGELPPRNAVHQGGGNYIDSEGQRWWKDSGGNLHPM